MESHELNPEVDPRLKGALEDWRAAAIVAGERPEGFWAHQRRVILDRTGQRRAFSLRPLLVWGTVVVVIVATSLFMIHEPRALPSFDFAAGYDHDLLLDVERLTSAQMPCAFEPASLLTIEMEASNGTTKSAHPEEKRRQKPSPARTN